MFSSSDHYLPTLPKTISMRRPGTRLTQFDVVIPAQCLPTPHHLYEIPAAEYVVGALGVDLARMIAVGWSASDAGLPPWKPFYRALFLSSTARWHAPTMKERTALTGRAAEEAAERLRQLAG